MSEDKLRFAGDVSIEHVIVTSATGYYKDITNQVLGIQIFEDLFAPFITGTLLIKESFDLLNVFPLTGEEYVKLKIVTPELPLGAIEGEFYLYKMSNREVLSDKAIVYELHFITQEAVVDMNKAVSRAFKGKPSEIAHTLFTDMDVGLQLPEELINIEESVNDIKFVSNFWNPTRCLQYLCDHAFNENDSPTYTFFQNRAGFNFVTLDAMYNTGEVIEYFIQDNYVRDRLPSGRSVRNIAEDYRRIRTVSIPVVHDYMERLLGGMYGSKQYGFDFTSKSVNIRNYDMLEEWDKTEHTNYTAPNSERTVYTHNAKILRHQRQFDLYTGEGNVSNEPFSQRRLSMLKLAEASKIQITVPGRTQYTVGQKCLVELPRIEPMSEDDSEDDFDRMLSGAYIIGAIHHYIDREGHECVMDLLKDSVYKDINETITV